MVCACVCGGAKFSIYCVVFGGDAYSWRLLVLVCVARCEVAVCCGVRRQF